MPRVLNKHKDEIPQRAVYVGRPTSYGNPFTHVQTANSPCIMVADRNTAVVKFEQLMECYTPVDVEELLEGRGPRVIVNNLLSQAEWIRNHVKELKGKDLVCWCAPNPCHADVLLRLANKES